MRQFELLLVTVEMLSLMLTHLFENFVATVLPFDEQIQASLN